MSFNNITSPGGFLVRLALKIIKNRSIYSNYEKKSSELIQYNYHVKISESCLNSKINEIFKELTKVNGITVFLHGSWADNTNNDFSDIDDFIILDDYKIEKNSMKKIIFTLNNIDMKFCRIDPLQHHGHWITSQSELNDYDSSFIPLFIINNGKIILGNPEINANINKDKTKYGLIKNIKATCKNIKILSKKLFNKNINIYQLKGLVGSFALMPAFIFQLLGKEYDKPTALKESKKFFSKDSLELIKWSTEIRNNWDIVTKSIRYKIFCILPYFFVNPHIWRRISSKISPKVDYKKLTNIYITEEKIDLFIKESIKYIDK